MIVIIGRTPIGVGTASSQLLDLVECCPKACSHLAYKPADRLALRRRSAERCFIWVEVGAAAEAFLGTISIGVAFCGLCPGGKVQDCCRPRVPRDSAGHRACDALSDRTESRTP